MHGTPASRRSIERRNVRSSAAPCAWAAAVALLWLPLLLGGEARAGEAPSRPIDFNREIRPILSNACFTCHGPDAAKRKGASKPLRLDTEAGAFADLGGYAAVVRGQPDESELIQRIISDDPTEMMPPKEVGKRLTPKDVELLTEWVKQGAPYAKHWSYVKPVRPARPQTADAAWSKNGVDDFILARLEREKLKPAAEADRFALIRRLSLDLTGLPPTLAEVDAFVNDARPDAYDRLVDRLLDKQTYGEHWARMWLDLARYADSAGYADDPPRTIWGYRDYVVRSLNANKPFDVFTIEQLAGDLLPNPTEDQLVATAFHRNTLTNNEGGTNDEEFRNVAVVDRVNTTMAVWMGTTIACAQCHDHKYDPLSQEEYFKLFAFFNNTQDRDLKDESPLLPCYTDEQKSRKASLERERGALETTLQTSTPSLAAGQRRWESSFPTGLRWKALRPSAAASRSTAKLSTLDDGSIRAESVGGNTDVYTLKLPVEAGRLQALRLETLPDDSLPDRGPGHAPGGKYMVSRVLAAVAPPGDTRPVGRFVRVELPGSKRILSLAEVQVFNGAENVAVRGQATATQSSTGFSGPAPLAIDGVTNGDYDKAKSTTHTEVSDDPWWELDLKQSQTLDRIVVWNRTDNNLAERLNGFRLLVLNEARETVWSTVVATAPKTNAEYALSKSREVEFVAALSDDPATSATAAAVLNNTKPATQGWGGDGASGRPRALTLLTAAPVELEAGATLTVTIEQVSRLAKHTLGRFRLSVSDDPGAAELARTPEDVVAVLRTPETERTEAQQKRLAQHYRARVAPELSGPRARLAAVEKELAALKPETTVPIQRELSVGERRKTQVQRRGNFLDLGAEVAAGVPAVFPPLPSEAPPNRLTLARWLVDAENPLTARVIANRCWEQIFGAGLVPTSEEFGSQGEPPTHAELLDWLATELVQNGWDLKKFLKLLVSSAAYRQDSKVAPELVERDPDNQLLARGPRFRLSAEMIRDQSLAVSGLLSSKMYGPPVKPPQPSSGLAAAFGGGIDWTTSPGADRYRRGLYTTWRRSNPYPSMATFDAPNREVCTLRRMRTNTPLQALVTLNDPVYVEAAQALARRIAAEGGNGAGVAEKVRYGFRLCVSRPPTDVETDRLARLYETTRESLSRDAKQARELASNPLGPLPEGSDPVDLAAWTVVGNVLLNLDEMLMKR